jgi:adenylate cyclase
MTREQRRLSAIVSVDVVGYSRLMGSDEHATVTKWKALRRELIEPKLTEYGGRAVNTAGDNQLQEFPSVVDAVRCSVDIQRGMAERNADAPADQRIDLRIGINIGDVISDGDQIFGDGVNVAARVQALAPPGGVCASKVVRDQVLDKVNFIFEDLGEHEVKNIAHPVEVYRVDFGETLPAPVAATAKPLRVAIAVLPFASAAGRADEEEVADTLTRDLTSALVKIMRMSEVVSQDLAASYKGKSINPRKVGKELDASYLIEGEVRQVADRFEVNAQFIDTANTTQLWGEQIWNEPLNVDPSKGTRDTSVLLSRFLDRIVNANKAANFRRFAGPPAPNAKPLELTWHAYSIWDTDNNTVRGSLDARQWFDQALRIDPHFLPAVRGRWDTLRLELDLDPKAEHARILREMDDLSSRAVSIASTDPPAWHNRAETLIRQQRWEAALEANIKAEKLVGTAVGWVLSQRAEIMLLTGRPEEALTFIDRQQPLDLQDQEELGRAMLQRGRACMSLGRYDEAIAAFEKEVAVDNWWLPHLYLVAGYSLKGDDTKAASEEEIVLELRPGTTIADFKRLYGSDNPVFVQQTEAHLLTGLRKAGFPEGEALPARNQGRAFLQRIARYLGLQFLGHLTKTPAAAATSPLRVAVAILPFAASGRHRDEEMLAEELTRGLTSSLASKLRMTQVLSGDLVAPYKGKAIDPRRVGLELNTSYVVQGEVQRVDQRIGVSVQLIDAASAAQLWSDRYELDQSPPQNEVADLLAQLSERIHKGVNVAGLRRFAAEPESDAGPLELTWHGYAVMYRDNNTVRGALDAREWFERALQLDVDFLPAIQGRFHTLMYELEFDPDPDHDRILREGDRLSSRAVTIDASNAISWFNRVRALIWQKRWEGALEALANAEKRSPATVGWHLNLRAEIMVFSGRPKDALTLIERQLALDPQDQEERGRAMLQRCRACMALGDYDEAIAAGERNVALDDWWMPHLYLAAGYALRGEAAKAAAEKTLVFELRPGTTIADFKKLFWSDNAAFFQQTEAHLLTGLRKAGFPEE